MKFTISIIIALLMSSIAFAQNDTAIMLDGSRVSQNVKSIADGKVTFDGDAPPVDMQGLRRIERAIEATTHEATARVHMLDGGMLRATAITMNDVTCQLTWLYGQLKLPIASVRGIRLSDESDAKKLPAGHDTFAADLNTPPTDKDRLFVTVENKVESLPGVFVDLSAEKVKFSFDNQERELERGKVFGMTLAGGGKKADLTGMTLIHLADGSTIWATISTVDNGAATLKLASGLDLKLPWAAISRIDVRSDRLTFLSDLEPTDVEEKAIAYVGPWQKDRSVRGKALIIKGKTFDKGIGVHATSRLSFNIDPKFNIFAATIGIDDMTKGKGDCEFVVLADGKELFRKRIKGSDQPEEVRVPLGSAKKLTLVVEAGEDLDFADHGNWGDARLIRE